MTNRVERIPLFAVFSVLLPALASLLTGPAPAAAVSETEELVDRSRLTIETLLEDPDFAELRPFVERARGVLIFPQLLKGGFILGGEGGSGVFLVKGSDESWSAPAFYTLAAGSIGLQIGGQVSEAVFTVMNDGAVDAILNSQFKLGADASVAIGPIGKGYEASTTANLALDIYAFSKVAGAFGGGAFEGAAVLARESLNTEYYGTTVTPRDIVIDRKVFNPTADRLRGVLADAKSVQSVE